MTGPTIKLEHELEIVYLRPGQSLTVYMGRDQDELFQVELRMFPDGTKEVWTPAEVAVCDWELGHWTPM